MGVVESFLRFIRVRAPRVVVSKAKPIVQQTLWERKTQNKEVILIAAGHNYILFFDTKEASIKLNTKTRVVEVILNEGEKKNFKIPKELEEKVKALEVYLDSLLGRDIGIKIE